MHAVAVRVRIRDRESAETMLNEEIVPRVSQSPGFIAGYWTNLGGDKGASMIVLESEEAATNVAERIRENPTDFVEFDSVEVGEVVAHA